MTRFALHLVVGVTTLLAIPPLCIQAGEKCFQWVIADYGSYCAYAALDCETNEWTEENWMPPWTSLPGECGCGDPNCIPPSFVLKTFEKKTGHAWQLVMGKAPRQSRQDPKFGLPTKGITIQVEDISHYKLAQLTNASRRTVIIKCVQLRVTPPKGNSFVTYQAWETDDNPRSYADYKVNSLRERDYFVEFEDANSGAKIKALLSQ